MNPLKNWKSCVKNLNGKKVEITKTDTGINTTGKSGTISEFDSISEKYEIDFNNGFSGWYSFNEFKFI